MDAEKEGQLEEEVGAYASWSKDEGSGASDIVGMCLVDERNW